MMADVARWIDRARHAVALTGAGVSTDSGIPDFRSDAGLWTEVDPMDVASTAGFEEDPERFYRFWIPKLAKIRDAQPSAAHRFLARLESRGRMQAVITQNVDGLHQKAGSRRVLEMHGSFRKFRCQDCGHTLDLGESVDLRERAEPPTCPACTSQRVKPSVVLFGDMLGPVLGEAEREIRDCDLLLCLGSSLAVFPVAGLVPLARRSGAKVVILNREGTGMDDEADAVLRGELSDLVQELAAPLGL
jgi:NAD-dependent deacetylase